jgi:hypothetical protein
LFDIIWPKCNHIWLWVFGHSSTLDEDVSSTSKWCIPDTFGTFSLELGTLRLLQSLLSVTNTIKIATTFCLGGHG